MAFVYTWLPDVAIADAAFQIEADSLSELFVAAALATTEVMVELGDIQPSRTHFLQISAENREDLLYQWLSEIIYVKDVKGLVFTEFEVQIESTSSGVSLRCLARGEQIDQKRHHLGRDVKAVTYHLFEIKEVGGKYKATVVLDI